MTRAHVLWSTSLCKEKAKGHVLPPLAEPNYASCFALPA